MDITPLGPSPHFSWAELTFSQTALRSGIDNTPPPGARVNLARLAVNLLEPARLILGTHLHVDSGYRSPEINTLVGSTALHGGAHPDGRAADVIPIGMDVQTAFNLLRQKLKGWDQLIFECKAWIHMAIPVFGVPPRLEALLAYGSPGHWTYARAA